MQSIAAEPPGPGLVRIDVAYTGICGTDLHIYHGDMDARVDPPRVIGHEMSELPRYRLHGRHAIQLDGSRSYARPAALQHGALVEPAAVAVHDVRRAELQPGEKTLVAGCGPIGLLIAAVARREGADLRLMEPDPY